MNIHWKKISKDPFAYILVGLFVVFFIYRVAIPYSEHPNSYGRSDFTVFYSAAEVLTEDKNPYDHSVLKPVIRQHRPYEAAFTYLYPPTAALVFTPLLIFKFKFAVYAWVLITIASLYGIAYLAQSLIGRKFTLRDWSLITIVFILLGPIYTNMRLGQVNILLAFLFMLMLWAFHKKKYNIAGTSLAALALIKVFPAALLFYFIVKKQWRAVAATIVAGLIILTVSIAAFGFQAHLNYADTLRQVAVKGIGEQNDIVSYDNATINGTMQRVITFNRESNQLTAGEVRAVQAIRLVAMFIVGTMLVVLTWWRRSLPISITEATLWVLSIFLLSTEIHAQYFVWFIPLFIVYFLNYVRSKPADATIYHMKKWSAIILVFIFLLYSFSSLKRFSFILDQWYFSIVALSFIASVLLFGWLLFQLWQDKRIQAS